MQPIRWLFTSCSLVLILAACVLGQVGSVPYIAINQAEIDGQIWGIPGDGVTDATAKLQAAVTFAVTNKRTLLLRRPSVAYKITDRIIIGTGTAVTYGLDIKGIGMPRILWAGGANKPMFDIVSVAESRFENLWLDGASFATVTGIRVRCTAGFPSQRLTFRGLLVEHCGMSGLRLIQDVNATADYMDFQDCTITSNGDNVHIQGDMRAVDFHGGAIADATTYGVNVTSGCFNAWGTTFLTNGWGSVWLGSNLSGMYLSETVHEDHPVLTGGGSWDSYSPLLRPIVLSGVKQDMYILPFPAGPAIDYDGYKTLNLFGCQFVQSINIGANALNVVSVNTEFVPFAYSAINAAFTGQTQKVGQLGRGTDGLPELFIGPFRGQLGDAGYDHTVTLEFDGSWDNESWPLSLQLPRVGAMTLLAVDAYAVGSNVPTLTFNLEIRADATINTAGTDVWAVPVTATAAGLHSTVFTASALTAGCHLWWKTGAAAATGTVDGIKLVIKAR